MYVFVGLCRFLSIAVCFYLFCFILYVSVCFCPFLSVSVRSFHFCPFLSITTKTRGLLTVIKHAAQRHDTTSYSSLLTEDKVLFIYVHLKWNEMKCIEWLKMAGNGWKCLPNRSGTTRQPGLVWNHLYTKKKAFIGQEGMLKSDNFIKFVGLSPSFAFLPI